MTADLPPFSGCICPAPREDTDGEPIWDIDPECTYHQVAAAHPHDHRIPWNCPTFYDGCNCGDPAYERCPHPWTDDHCCYRAPGHNGPHRCTCGAEQR